MTPFELSFCGSPDRLPVMVAASPTPGMAKYLVPDRIVKNAIQIKGLPVKYGLEEFRFGEPTRLASSCKLLISLRSPAA
jgi:hypothetical protein